MTFRTEKIASPSGATLNLHISEADSPQALVQVNHGLAEHSARYARFADALRQRGYTVLAHDHRGHGHTSAPGAPLGRFADSGGAAKVIDDAAFVLDLAGERYPSLPRITFGHSMGGLIALNLVARHPAKMDAAAVWNANSSAGLEGRLAKAILRWEKFRLGSDVPSHLLPRLTFQAWGQAIPGHRTPFDWLSRDPAEVDAYITDPLCGWDASVSLWQDLFGLIFWGADDHALADIPRTLPFNLVGGEKDPATNGGKSVRHLAERLRRLGFSNLETRIYDETRHESLNELNRDIITADFIAWLDRVT